MVLTNTRDHLTLDIPMIIQMEMAIKDLGNGYNFDIISELDFFFAFLN